MAPGTWARLNASNQDGVLGVGSVSHSMLGYCNSMPWNPVSQVIEIVGMDHNYGRQRHARYVEASNSFVLVADDDGLGSQVQHGYDHNSVNPSTGELYHRYYSGFSGRVRVYKKAHNGSSFVEIPSVTANPEQVAIGSCWWSGSFAGGGAQGQLVIFNSGNAYGNSNDGEIMAYNPLTNAWFFRQAGMAPNYGSGDTYHSLIEYSAKKNVAVYGGGNAARSKLWRLNSDRSVTAMPSVPSGKEVGIERGRLVDDPVTGNFLLFSAGELWELNPTGSGTWTQQTGSRVPPSGVGIPGSQFGICTSIPEYGVVAVITQPEATGGTFYLYKHA